LLFQEHYSAIKAYVFIERISGTVEVVLFQSKTILFIRSGGNDLMFGDCGKHDACSTAGSFFATSRNAHGKSKGSFRNSGSSFQRKAGQRSGPIQAGARLRPPARGQALPCLQQTLREREV
jgi:hypothetical protein